MCQADKLVLLEVFGNDKLSLRRQENQLAVTYHEAPPKDFDHKMLLSPEDTARVVACLASWLSVDLKAEEYDLRIILDTGSARFYLAETRLGVNFRFDGAQIDQIVEFLKENFPKEE